MKTDLIQALATEAVDYSSAKWYSSAEVLQEYTRLVVKECTETILAGRVFGVTNPESPLLVYNRACEDSVNEVNTHFGM